MSHYDVTVIVLTYNPNWNKLQLTLDSIIVQKEVNVQIVVADDGSKDNCLECMTTYFREKNWKDYICINSEVNQGTVKNLIDALKYCQGNWIKLISPGDFLYDKECLSNWLKMTEESYAEWSFAEAVYYTHIDGSNIHTISEKARPFLIDVYEKKQTKLAKWNYLVYEDSCNGAATLCNRKILSKYIARLENYVIYTEDCVYKLMMNDNLPGYYYSEPVIYYEHGTGISTQKNKEWECKINQDLIATAKIIKEDPQTEKPIQKQMQRYIWAMNHKGAKVWKTILMKGRWYYVVKRKLFPRKTII